MTVKNNPSQTETLSDEVFMVQFENQSLLPKHFDHIGHMRLAWLYLERYNLEPAINRVCSGIKAYAQSLGASMKFHFTLTDAIVRIIALRKQEQQDWQMFVQSNADLVGNAKAVIHQYYSKEALASEQARLHVVKPDIKAIG